MHLDCSNLFVYRPTVLYLYLSLSPLQSYKYKTCFPFTALSSYLRLVIITSLVIEQVLNGAYPTGFPPNDKAVTFLRNPLQKFDAFFVPYSLEGVKTKGITTTWTAVHRFSVDSVTNTGTFDYRVTATLTDAISTISIHQDWAMKVDVDAWTRTWNIECRVTGSWMI
jgi:hypothetical protein